MSECAAIIIRIAANRAAEFKEMFPAEELPLWDETRPGAYFSTQSLTRVEGGSDSSIRVSAASDRGTTSPSNTPGGFVLWELRSTTTTSGIH